MTKPTCKTDGLCRTASICFLNGCIEDVTSGQVSRPITDLDLKTERALFDVWDASLTYSDRAQMILSGHRELAWQVWLASKKTAIRELTLKETQNEHR